jgi:three-Cys-motif partner protein
MGHQALKVHRSRPGSKPRLLLVDGFAGPGRYTGGEPGSPLIMLEALTSHQALLDLAGVTFLYFFIEQDERRIEYLQRELGKLTLPPNVVVRAERGRFETTFGAMMDEAKARARVLVPTFAFIDPFGYSEAPMSLTGRFLDFPRSEALFFLPLSYIHRFVGRSGQEAALTALFDGEGWRDAVPVHGKERRDFLIGLFERQLQNQGQVAYVRSFELRTRDRNDYRLVFATSHIKGLQVMKRAMWSVDPLEGTRHLAHTDSGQEVLFKPDVDTSPLLKELQSVFRRQWFTPGEAGQVALLRTPFLDDKHLKTLTLVPAEKAGSIEVRRPAQCRAGSFTDDVKIRFV